MLTLTCSQKQISTFKEMNLLTQAELARLMVLTAVFFAGLR